VRSGKDFGDPAIDDALAVAVEPSLAEVLKGAKIFAIDADYAGANRKRIVDRWIAEVLNP